MSFLLPVLSGLALSVMLFYGAYVLIQHVDPAIAGGAITAASAVIISAITIAFGRYFEKRTELDALHREKKIPIYREFLEGLFNVFYGRKAGKRIDSVAFLQKWQTQIVLWGGAEVVNAYLRWSHALKGTEPNAHTLHATNSLVLAIRKELGYEDKDLSNDLFARLILRDYGTYSSISKHNPDITLAELADIEAKGKGGDASKS